MKFANLFLPITLAAALLGCSVSNNGLTTNENPSTNVSEEPMQVETVDASQVTIGNIAWYVNYDAALKTAKQKNKPIWLHFGENPGWAGCREFASGPLTDNQIVKASESFVPLFIDTLTDLKQTKRFGENYGSYPVLRIHDLAGKEIGGRIDGNRVAGRIPVNQVLEQFKKAKSNFKPAKKS